MPPLPFTRRQPLKDRVVLVTGASSGIGEAVAVACAAKGAQVLLVARRGEELERVADRIGARGGRAATYAVDLTDGEAVDALVRRIETEQGGVDYLVNNAGRSIRRSIELSYDRFHDIERTMAINYFGPVRLTMGLLPGMRERRFGHVVNIVTWGVTLKAPKFSAYIASKTALDTWARIVARETRGDNVTFTNVRMSLVQTPMTQPTEAYRGRGLTIEQATDMVMAALVRRPLTVQTVAGRVGQLAEVFVPNTFEALVSRASRMFPDSEAARRR